MGTKVVVMPRTKRFVRFRIGGKAYQFSVDVAVEPLPPRAPAPLIIMPGGPKPSAK